MIQAIGSNLDNDIKKLTVVRYADDFVVIHKDRNMIIAAKQVITEWLKVRGLNISEEKTKIVNTTEGFEFLSFHFKHYHPRKARGNHKKRLIKEGRLQHPESWEFVIKPSKSAMKIHRKKLHDIFYEMRAQSQENLIKRLNPTIAGWANYHRYNDCTDAFNSMDAYMYQLQRRWAYRRHNKGGRWLHDTYNIRTVTRRMAFLNSPIRKS